MDCKRHRDSTVECKFAIAFSINLMLPISAQIISLELT